MKACSNMVIYDQWSYMTMFGALEVMFTALREGIQIDRLLFWEIARNRRFAKKLSFNFVYLQVSGQDPVILLEIMARVTTKIDPTCLWLADAQFSYAGAQCAAVEPKDFCSPVLAAHFPIGLLEYPDNMVAFNRFQRFLRGG